jgi:hypothetical protein
MFFGARNFNQELDLDTSNGMFESALAFNADLREWDTSSAQFMARMFYNASSFAQELCWDLSQVATVSEMLCSTPARLDPSCTPSDVLEMESCDGGDPSPAATGKVVVIVLVFFIGAVIFTLQFRRWQLVQVSERGGSGTAPGKDA